MRKLAISDIHGCKKTFEALLDKLAFTKSDELYLLGDYIDRGPDSKGVLDVIMQLQQDGYTVKCLRGNHEQMMLDYIEATQAESSWKVHGGLQTLASFGVTEPNDIPEKYINFIKNMGLYFEVDEYILVHAGLNFKIEDPLKDERAMLWIRRWYMDIRDGWLGNRVVVHGHTPMGDKEIKLHLEAVKDIKVVDIDNGCCFTRPDLGRLCAFDMTNRELIFQGNVETVVA